MKYVVWNPEHGDREDGREIESHSAEAAVRAWAERDDAESADYLIVRGNDATVQVWDGERERTYIVSGESVPEYRARLVVVVGALKQDAQP